MCFKASLAEVPFGVFVKVTSALASLMILHVSFFQVVRVMAGEKTVSC